MMLTLCIWQVRAALKATCLLVAALAVFLKYPVKTNIDFKKNVIHKMNRMQNVRLKLI